MTDSLFATFLRVMEVIQPAFSPRVYARLVVILIGWVRTQGRHAITETLLATHQAMKREHSGFHRVFSSAKWDIDEAGRLLLDWILARWAVDTPVRLVLDDTLAPHKGPQIFGIGSHLDAVHSTQKQKIFRFGLQWVVLSVVVPLPFASRAWALPILFRLYRTRDACERARESHLKKTEIARAMIDLVAAWLPDRRLEVTADQAYTNRTVMRGLPDRIQFFGSMRPDARLDDIPSDPRRKRGQRLPTPEQLAKDPTVKWSHTRVHLYGRARTIAYKTVIAQWYHALGSQPVRIVVVRSTTGTRSLRVYLCTEPKVSVPALLQTYADRWPQECTFRDLKQLLGFSESSARTEQAVRRTAPMIGLLYTMLALWFHECRLGDALDVIPDRPWYRTKRSMSFGDVLRTAQDTFARVDLVTEVSRIDNLHRAGVPTQNTGQLPLSFAA